MTIDKTKPVLVTGGTGYLASWIVKQLLDEGLTVHATVRNKTKIEKYKHLLELSRTSKGEVKIFEADLLNPHSFKAAMEGCELVMHTASPFIMQAKNPTETLIKPALEGTKNVLNTANETPSVKRIVLTSSVVAILGDNKDAASGKVDESDWNTSSSLKHQPYNYSKKLAEEEAWKIMKAQNQWDLVTINPAFIMGPSLTKRKDSASISMMTDIGSGRFKSGVPGLYFGTVDVRDVAQGHIKAGFTPTAQGRHILSNKTLSFLDYGKILRAKFGNRYSFPKGILPKFMLYLVGPMIGFSWKFVSNNIGISVEYDNTKSKKELGIVYRPVEDTLTEHFQQLVDDGFIK